MCYTVGNSAAVFRIRHQGRIRSLRCYMRPAHRLDAIYGDRLLRGELFLHATPDTGEWVDVVVDDWIEGTTLTETIAAAVRSRDTRHLTRLSASFDRLAGAMLTDDWAHGDLKPENIIVSPDGNLHPIDFDAVFLPAFAGEQSPELGTAAYQHPARTACDFDTSLDDYPIALISTALHVLALDPTYYDRFGDNDGLLFTPHNILCDEALHQALILFEQKGCAAEYRIARLLYSPTLRLPGLGTLLAWLVQSPAPAESTPELYAENGLWGYRTPDRTIIPPLYDCGFDFTEGLAAVRLGATWHYIDLSGKVRLSHPDCEAVKPFRKERAQIIRNGRRFEIDTAGAEFDI